MAAIKRRPGQNFTHGASGYSNFACRCDVCKAGKSAEAKAYRDANQEARRAANETWRKANTAWIRAYGKVYRPAHRGEANAYWATYRETKPDKVRAVMARWYVENPEKVRAARGRRKAHVRNADKRAISDRDMRRLLAGPCAYCGAGGEITVEHVIPLARGGRHAIGNLLPACLRCNCSKRHSLLIEWKGRPTHGQTA